MAPWVVGFEKAFEDWLCELGADAQDFVVAAIELLEEFGPSGELVRTTIPRADQVRTFVLPRGHITLRYRADAGLGAIVLSDGYIFETTDLGRLQFVRALEASATEPSRLGDSRVQ